MLILVRHGQTSANAEGRLLGRRDLELTDHGRLQAAALAASITSIDRVVSSPLLRARSTAEMFGCAVEVDDRWIEVDYGDYEGQRLGELPAEVWSRWRDDPAFVPPSGESLASVGERVRSACAELATEAVDHDVVVVSHVSPIKAAICWALDLADHGHWRLRLGVASISRIAICHAGPLLVSYNEIGHLPT
ncbi:MAG TPA: histidine phosphatase family protein [Acidimicrobiales bacterium]|nr:histidine phosphatase family protein [Acidimicrobiales bacterium]